MKLEGYSDYEIYPETGQVWSYKSNRYIGAFDKDGYLIVGLVGDNGIKKHFSIHRLVWILVNGEVPDGLEINHLDENKENNSIDNLSLTSHKENANWGTRNERIIKNRTGKYKPKPVLAIENGNIKMYFVSARAAENIGYFSSSICRCCNGLKKEYKGYQWIWLEDYLADWWDNEMEKAA